MSEIENVPPHELTLPIAWVGVEELPILAANQFLVQVAGKDEILLTAGHLAPPPFLGTPEEKMQQVLSIGFAAVRPVTRLAFTQTRLRDLIRVLSDIAEAHDRLAAEESTA